MKAKSKHHHPLRWVIWGLAAVFYFYEFFIRVAPSVMVPELMTSFGVDATAIGTLSAFYFFIYAPMQLPVGVLTDRYGARRLLALAAFGAGLGTLLFALAPTYWVAAVGRLLMGAGSAFGFVGMIYICAHWFDLKKRGILIGVANGLGMLGAVFGEGPLRYGLDFFGWRVTLFGLAITGFALSTLIYLIVRNDPPEVRKREKERRRIKPRLWQNLSLVAKNPYSWLNALVAFFIYATTPVFAALWGIPFLHATYDISIEKAGFAISTIFIGWAIGGPLLGRLSDVTDRKKELIMASALLGTLCMSLIVWVPHIELFILFLLLFFVGVASSSQLLNFGYTIDINPPQARGTAAAFTNAIIIGLSSLALPFVGSILDRNWAGIIVNGARVYPPEAYTKAMTCFPIFFALAFVSALFLKPLRWDSA